MEKVRVLITNANPDLYSKVSEHLGIKPLDCEIGQFSNSESRIVIKENLRGMDIYILSTGASTNEWSVNDYFMETALIVDACRRSNANNIIVVFACYPYARQDKKDRSRAPIGASLIANMLKTAGVNRIISVDLHAEQIQGMTNCPFDNLFVEKYFKEYIEKYIENSPFSKEDFIIVSPDAGAVKRATKLADKLDLGLVIMSKTRNSKVSNTIDKIELIGNVQGKIAIIYDDMADTCGTLVKATDCLIENGAKQVIAMAIHGVLSGKAIKVLNESQISLLVTTNTLSVKEKAKQCSKIDIIDISELLANTIKLIATNGSVSSLF